MPVIFLNHRTGSVLGKDYCQDIFNIFILDPQAILMFVRERLFIRGRVFISF